MKKLVLLAISGVLIAAGCSRASLGESAKSSSDSHFLGGQVSALAASVPAPPPYDSPADQKELGDMLIEQAMRPQESCVRATGEIKVSLENFYGPGYGFLDRNGVARFNPLFAAIQEDVTKVVHTVKKLYNRPRPYEENPQIRPCLAKEKSSSYPSEHAAVAEVFAKTLELILPRLTQQLEFRAEQIDQDRVVSGLHRLSDVQAGRTLGDQIFASLRKNPDFNAQVQALKMRPI
jgi:acid phosphatase (class A)